MAEEGAKLQESNYQLIRAYSQTGKSGTIQQKLASNANRFF